MNDPPRVVLDTNILVGFTNDGARRPHALLAMLMERRIIVCLDQPTLKEYHDKLPLWPGGEKVVRQVLQYGRAELTRTDRFHNPGHPEDDHLFNLAIRAKADVITWEGELLRLPQERPALYGDLKQAHPECRIMNPEAFLRWYSEQPRPVLSPITQSAERPGILERDVGGKTLQLEAQGPSASAEFQRAILSRELVNLLQRDVNRIAVEMRPNWRGEQVLYLIQQYQQKARQLAEQKRREDAHTQPMKPAG